LILHRSAAANGQQSFAVTYRQSLSWRDSVPTPGSAPWFSRSVRMRFTGGPSLRFLQGWALGVDFSSPFASFKIDQPERGVHVLKLSSRIGTW